MVDDWTNYDWVRDWGLLNYYINLRWLLKPPTAPSVRIWCVLVSETVCYGRVWLWVWGSLWWWWEVIVGWCLGKNLQETGKQEAGTGRTGFLCAHWIFVAIFSR